MATTITSQSDWTRTVWRACLASALRSALACTIIGCTTLYGPAFLGSQVQFPAFSYVVAILIATNALLGDTLRACWLALYATVLGVCPAILSLWVIGPTRFTTRTTAVAVALSAFVVALPESTHLLAKRIALGQIVIVYVIAFINGVHTEAIMHPVHVASSTALGVVACVLALLLPYPSLACHQVEKNCKLFADNASERLRLFMKAFCAEDSTSAAALVCQAKPLGVIGAKLLQSIKSMQESMHWERFPIKFLKPYCMETGERFQDLEVPLRGMDMAIANLTTSSPDVMLHQEIKNGALKLKDQIDQTLNHIKNNLPYGSLTTVPEPNDDSVMMEPLQILQTIPPTQKDLPQFFFLFCLKLLQDKTAVTSSSLSTGSAKVGLSDDDHSVSGWVMDMGISRKRLMPAFKCSLSLGLAVFFGLIYSKKNGYWSALPVAISLASAREATFKVANLKAQGTVLGTVYGVFGCFLFEKFVQIRFLSLLPWLIITAFLARSRMYGQAGGISAVIGATLILGRKNFGPPSEFAIARIMETFIGLSCSIMVEILLQPTRASSLAKLELSRCLQAMHECVTSISLSSSKTKLEGAQKKLKNHVNELRKLTGEAEAEPNFWFVPFHSACYCKLLASLSKMVDLFLFEAHAIGFLEQESPRINLAWKGGIDNLDSDLKRLKEVIIAFSLSCFEDMNLITSSKVLENKHVSGDDTDDIELGKSANPKMALRVSSDEDDEIEEIMSSYLQHSREVVDRMKAVEGDHEVNGQMVLSLTSLAFCMTCLIKETKEIEKGIKELVQWGNPSS